VRSEGPTLRRSRTAPTCRIWTARNPLRRASEQAGHPHRLWVLGSDLPGALVEPVSSTLFAHRQDGALEDLAFLPRHSGMASPGAGSLGGESLVGCMYWLPHVTCEFSPAQRTPGRTQGTDRSEPAPTLITGCPISQGRAMCRRRLPDDVGNGEAIHGLNPMRQVHL
jgi:hypothetical protein